MPSRSVAAVFTAARGLGDLAFEGRALRRGGHVEAAPGPGGDLGDPYELARELHLGKGAAMVPPLWTAKTGAGSNPRGSVYRGVSWLHRALLRPGQFTIHPRCTSLIESMSKYRGGSTDPHGHLVDALRYALDHWINKGQTRNLPPGTLVT